MLQAPVSQQQQENAKLHAPVAAQSEWRHVRGLQGDSWKRQVATRKALNNSDDVPVGTVLFGRRVPYRLPPSVTFPIGPEPKGPERANLRPDCQKWKHHSERSPTNGSPISTAENHFLLCFNGNNVWRQAGLDAKTTAAVLMKLTLLLALSSPCGRANTCKLFATK